MPKNRDLHSIGLKASDLFIRKNWRPTNDRIKRRFGINDMQLRRVKHYYTEWGVANSVMIGYNPELICHMAAPHNAPEVARPILTYAIRHWMDEGTLASLIILGGNAQGYVTDEDKNLVTDIRNIMDSRLKSIYSTFSGMGYPKEAYSEESMP